MISHIFYKRENFHKIGFYILKYLNSFYLYDSYLYSFSLTELNKIN